MIERRSRDRMAGGKGAGATRATAHGGWGDGCESVGGSGGGRGIAVMKSRRTAEVSDARCRKGQGKGSEGERVIRAGFLAATAGPRTMMKAVGFAQKPSLGQFSCWSEQAGAWVRCPGSEAMKCDSALQLATAVLVRLRQRVTSHGRTGVRNLLALTTDSDQQVLLVQSRGRPILPGLTIRPRRKRPCVAVVSPRCIIAPTPSTPHCTTSHAMHAMNAMNAMNATTQQRQSYPGRQGPTLDAAPKRPRGRPRKTSAPVAPAAGRRRAEHGRK